MFSLLWLPEATCSNKKKGSIHFWLGPWNRQPIMSPDILGCIMLYLHWHHSSLFAGYLPVITHALLEKSTVYRSLPHLVPFKCPCLKGYRGFPSQPFLTGYFLNLRAPAASHLSQPPLQHGALNYQVVKKSGQGGRGHICPYLSQYGCVWKCRENPIVPNGFADHYPVFKWLFHWEYTLFSDKPICHSTF